MDRKKLASDLTVVLLCRNRPSYATESLESIKRQNTRIPFLIVISDNSTGQYKSILSESLTGFDEYWTWQKDMSHFEHLSACMKRIKTKYYVLFHDDDLMLPTYINTLYTKLRSDESLSAISCNSQKILDSGKTDSSKTYVKLNSDIRFQESHLFLRRYLNAELGGVAPFSAYMYRNEKVKVKPNHNDARRYSDACFLTHLLAEGDILWVNSVCTLTRYHNENESHRSGVLDYKLFFNWVRLGANYEKVYQDLNHYRIANAISYFSRKKRNHLLIRRSFLLKFCLQILIQPTFFNRVLNKILRGMELKH